MTESVSLVTRDWWLVLEIQPIALLHSSQQMQVSVCSVPGRPGTEAGATGAVPALQEPQSDTERS